jgi:gas vesicle protein
MKEKNFWAGLLIGAAAGVAGALLCAPKSGSEVREDISGAAQDMGRKAGAAWGDVKDRTSKMAVGAKDKVTMAARKGGEVAGSTWDRAKEAVHAGKEAAAEKQKQLQLDLQEETEKLGKKS